ncbi:MAG: hypothetical protein Q7S79_03205 [bacterium]|nr:hypothetical protein [bacterium]
MTTVEHPPEVKPIVLDMDEERCLDYAKKDWKRGVSIRKYTEADNLVESNRYNGYNWDKVLDVFVRKGSFVEALVMARALRNKRLVTQTTAVSALRDASLFFYDRVLVNYQEGRSEARVLKHALRLVKGYETWSEELSR